MQVRGDTSRIYALGDSFISNCKNNRIRYIQVTLLFDKAFFWGVRLDDRNQNHQGRKEPHLCPE